MEKRLSRVISLLLAIMMIASLMPVSVHAAEAEDTGLTMSVSSVSGMPGDTVQVQIVLKNNPGLASMKFYVDYNEEVLTLTDVKLSTAFGSYITTPTPYKNHQPITLISPLADVSAEGVLATLTFVIAEDAKDNIHADVTVSFKQADVFNAEYEVVPLTVENGCVEVHHGIPGDINNDREVNTKDAILLFRYIAEWDVDVDTDALDVNGDNAINTKDAITLFRYIAEWPGITLHRGKVCTHELTHVAAQANTCDKEGNIEYWLCNLCGRVYKDADCQVITTLKDTVLPAIGHNYVDGTCKNCGDVIGPDDYLTDALGHHLIYYPAVESTCSLHGYAAHLVCETCNQIYNMSLVAISKEDLTLPLANHDLTYYEEAQPGEYCYEVGHIACYVCEACEQIYLDAEGTKEIDYEDALLYNNNHGKIWFVEAREGNCKEPGNIACYVCEDCESVFSDANGENRLKREDVLIYYDHLEIVYVEAKQATCAVAGNYAHYTCTACGSLFSDVNGEKELSADEVIMPTLAHKLVDGACTVCDSRESTAGLEFVLNKDGNSYTLIGIGDCKAEEIYVGLYNGLSVTVVSAQAFMDQPIKSITLGSCVTSIGENAFCGTGLTSFTVPSGVTKLGAFLFQNCEDLTALYIHANVTEIDDYTFYMVGTNFNTIEVDPANPVFTSINNTLINKKEGILVRGNSSGYIPDDGSVTEIGACAFHNVPLTKITIPDSIVRIGHEAFAYSGLQGIYISSGVREFGTSVFSGCNLNSVRVDASNPVLYMGTNCIINRETKTLILGFAGCVIPDDGSVTTIGESAFAECFNLTSIVIPASVTTIGDYAFSWSGLTSIVIPETVTYIGYGAFNGCQSLESATILANITVLNGWTFGYCSSLREVVIPNGVQTIESAAFYNCNALTEVTLPESVTSIDDRAFHNCRKLAKINYYGTAEQFEKIGFTIPNGATVVYEYGTHSFTYFEELPATCTTSGKKAHYYCDKCGHYFTDADGKQEISKNDLKIPSTGHSYGEDGTCTVCGASAAIDWQGKTLNVFANQWYSVGGAWAPVELWVTEYGQNALHDAILDRAAYIEETYNVSMKWTGQNATKMNAIADAIDAGTKDYDLWVNKILTCQSIVANGYVYDLTPSEYIDFSKSYYSQIARQQFTVGGHTFFATGDFNYIAYEVTYLWMVNNELASEISGFPEDIYETVRNGEWTLDLAFELAAMAMSDNNGNGKLDAEDTYGFCTNSLGNWYNYCGISSVESQGGEYKIGLDVTRTEKAIEYALNMLNSGWFCNLSWRDGTTIFNEGRCLFFQDAVNGISGYLSANPNLYIVPNPKLDANDSVYYTTGAYSQANSICIPKCTQDRAMSEYFFEVLFATASEQIMPKYLEERLINADSDSYEDIEDMLVNYIFPGALYDVGSQTYMWSTVCGNITSPSINNKVNTFMADYEANIDASQAIVDSWNAAWNAYEEDGTKDTTHEHDYVYYDAKEADCIHPGHNAYRICIACGDTDYVEIPAIGHNEVHHPGKEATCFELGWNSYVTCTECKYTTYTSTHYSHSFSGGECIKCGLLAGVSYTALDVNKVTFTGGANNWSGGAKELTDGNFAAGAALTPNSVITITVNGYAPTLVLYASNHHPEFPDAWDNGTDLVYTVEILVDGQWQLLGTYSQVEMSNDAVSTLIATEIAINRVVEEIRISTTTCTKFYSYLYEMEWKDTKDPTVGHELVFHEESADATCDHPGYTMYATCLHCDERFYFNTTPQLAHQLTHHIGGEATCEKPGTLEHWYCSSCDKYYLDEKGTEQVRLEQLVIPALGHSPEYFEEVQPESCDEPGHIACFVCDECERIFLDKECTKEISLEDALIYSDNHTGITFAEAREATCGRPGNIACYVCVDCERVFADANGETELSLDEVLIYSDAHTIVYVAAKEATCSTSGNVEYYTCSVCNGVFLDENGKQGTTLDQVIIPTISHVMVDGACSVCGLHESTAGLDFQLNPDGQSYTLTGIGSCTESEIYVGLYNGLPVTAVGFNAFMNNRMITEITLDSCVTRIEGQAFFACLNLAAIHLTDNVTHIGPNVFCSNPITSFTVPAGVTQLENMLFQNCDSLEEVIIHKNVTYIDSNAFRGCGNLERIVVAKENPVYASVNNTLINKESQTLIRGNKYGFIPDDGSVTTIGPNAFQYCTALTHLVIPDTIVSIQYNAFQGCQNLTYVYIPASVIQMEGSAFSDCTVTSMEIAADNPVFYAGENCIINRQAQTLVVGFAGCVIPDDGSVTVIGPAAFENCRDLTEIVIPNTITEIYSRAFAYTGLTSVVIPNSVTYLGDSVFQGCYNLVSVKISNNVTELYGWTFGNCESLTTVILPANLERILYNAFYGCTSLTEITLPATVEHVDSMAFEWCENLRIINYCGTKEQFTASNIILPDGVKVVYNYGNHKGVYHPAVAPTCTTGGNLEYYYCDNCGHYFSDTECKNEVFAKDVLIPAKGHSMDDNGVCAVCGAEALVTSEGLEFRLNEDGKSYTWIGLGSCTDTVVVVDTFNGLPVTTVATDALWDNRSVTEVILGESVTTIENGAFECAYALTTITMSNNVTYIGQNAFRNTALTSFVIPAGVTRLDQWGIFQNCRSLKEITLHAGVSYVYGGIFSGCGILDTITVAKGNPYYSMVNGCLVSTKGELVRATKGATIPTDGSITMIRSYAFAGMDQLEIQVPNSVTHIDSNAFCDCHIVSIFIPASVSYIDSYAFQNATIESIAVDEKNPTYAYVFGCFINRNTQTLVLGIGNCTIPADGSVTSIGQAAFAHNQSLTSLVIPDTITSIGSNAFQNCQSLQSIVLPSGLTRIEGWTFSGCSQLTSIVIPEGVTYIGRYAFQHCDSLKALIVPGAVLTIESGAFYGCSGLASVIISEGVTTIRDQAFGFCSNLETVTLPVSLTFVDASAFQNCYNLTTIRYAGTIEEFAALGLYLPEGVQIVCGYGDHEIIFMDAKDATCDEDGNVACYTCTKCGEFFSDAEGKNLLLKSQVIIKATGHVLVDGACTSCGKSEFESSAGLEFQLNEDGMSYTLINGRNCREANVIIDLYNGLPVTAISGWAFQNNQYVETVTLGNHVREIYNGAFAECRSLRSISLNQVTYLGATVFNGCFALESIVIPEGVLELGDQVLGYCASLREVTIPASVTYVDPWAFYCSGNIEFFHIAEGNEVYCVIGNSLVHKNDKRLVRGTNNTVIPDDGSVLRIGSFAFSGCEKLTSLVIPEGVIEIGDQAFAECPNLTSIHLPSTIQWVSGNTFAESSIQTITVAKDHPFIVVKDGNLINTDSKTLLVSMSGIIPTDGSVTSIGSYAFASNGRITSLVIPDCITSIESSAFYNCYNLQSVEIPNTVTYIGAYAFAQCNNLQSVTLPEGLTTIESGLFEGCNNLQSIVIPNTVTRIGNYAFNNCNALREVTIPNGVTYLGTQAFAWCNSLQKIVIPGTVEETGRNVLRGCNSLITVQFLGSEEEFAPLYNNIVSDLNVTVIYGCEVHALTYLEAKDASCYEEGNVACYACTVCSKYFEDAEGSIELSASQVILPYSHSLVEVAAKAATCTTPGVLAHLYCENCQKRFSPNGDKLYLGIYMNNSNGWSERALKWTGVNGAVFAYDSEAQTYVTTFNGNAVFFAASKSVELELTDVRYSGLGQKWFVATFYDANLNPVDVNELKEGTAYKFGTYNANYGSTYYVTGAVTDVRLLTTLNASKAADVYVQFVDGGICIYTVDPTGLVEVSYEELITSSNAHTMVDGSCSVCGGVESTAGLEFQLNADGMSYTLVNGSNCTEENVVIDLYNGLSVTVIGNHSFENNQTVKTVTIGASVKTIEYWAFAHCGNLTSVTLTEGLKTIGAYVFYNTGLTEISLPNSLKTIEQAAFMNCRNLSSLYIPENVTYIGEGVVTGTGITTVSVAAGNKYYYVWNNSLIGRQDQILLWGNADSLIPDGVTTIGSWAFYFCTDLEEVIIPDSVTHINHMAFAGCRNLELVDMSNHIEVIGYSAFSGCEKIQSIKLPATLTEIESYAFEYCRSLTEISIPASASKIGYEVFKCCSGVQTVTVDPANPYYYASGNCLIAYDTQALLFGCGTSVIPEGVTVIANSAFAGQEGITSIVIPEGVTAIGEEAFSACTNLVSVTLPSTMRELHTNAFVNCPKLEEINLPEGLTKIGEQAFASCNSLASIEIPSTVTEIGARAFSYCNNLTSIVLPEGLTVIDYQAFENCWSLTSIEIPSTVTEIGTYAFSWCTGLTSVVLPEGLTEIPDNIFYECVNLKDVTIPSTVQTIGYMAFTWCNSLTEIVIPEGVTMLDKQAFSHCQNLKSVTLPSSLVTILDSAFMDCPNLTDVYYLGTEEQFAVISSQIPSSATVHYGPKPETPETHEMVQVAAIAATCTTMGSHAYWLCMDCDKCFSDAEGTTELSANEIMIPALGHSMVNGVCQYCGSDAWDGSIATSFAGGSGTEEDPYLIENGAQLAYLAHAINTDPNNTLYDKCYKLTKSIDLDGRAFTPIAVRHYEGKAYDSLTFQGTFDGNGYAIKNFTISSYGGCFFGLFGYIASANIHDLDIANYSLSGELTSSVSAPGYTQFCVGAVAGYALHSSVDRCYVSCSIDVSGSSAAVGGIVGYSYSTISNCYVDANINSNMNNQSYVGGLCGEMGSASRADSCFVLAALTSFSQKSEGHAGGISGYMYALSDPAVFVNCVVNGTWQGGSNGGYYSGAGAIYAFGEGYSTGSGNNYSLSSTGGLSQKCTMEQLNDSSFYTDTLGWDANLWHFDGLDFVNGIYPVLMNN